jgi:hypothetical protein
MPSRACMYRQRPAELLPPAIFTDIIAAYACGPSISYTTTGAIFASSRLGRTEAARFIMSLTARSERFFSVALHLTLKAILKISVQAHNLPGND